MLKDIAAAVSPLINNLKIGINEYFMISQIVTLPNLITLFRIVTILPIIMLIQYHSYILAFILTILAQSSDFLDGYIARKTNSRTALGALLDPFADKVFIIFLLFIFTAKGLLSPYYFSISFIRDILQLLAIPILINYKKISFMVKPKLIPKIATALKYVIIVLLFLGMIIDFNSNLTVVLTSLLIISAILEFYVLITFFFRFLEIYKGQHNTFE